MANKILVNGANIQMLREGKKWTQAELGSKLGGIGSSKSARTIQRMENDSKYKCTKFMVEELAKVFEVPFEDLIINDKSTHEVSFIAIDEDASRENLSPEEMDTEIKKADYYNEQDSTQNVDETISNEIDESRLFIIDGYILGELSSEIYDVLDHYEGMEAEKEILDPLRQFKFIPTSFSDIASAVNNNLSYENLTKAVGTVDRKKWEQHMFGVRNFHDNKRQVRSFSKDKLFKGLSKAHYYSIDSDVPKDESALVIVCEIIETIEKYFVAKKSISDELRFQFKMSSLIEKLQQNKISIFSGTWESKKSGYGKNLKQKIFSEYHIRILIKNWDNNQVRDLETCFDQNIEEFSDTFIRVEWRDLIESEYEDKEHFMERAKKIHGDTYDYSNSEYVDSKINIKINCKTHGTFEQMPEKHLSGFGCPTCQSDENEIKDNKSGEN